MSPEGGPKVVGLPRPYTDLAYFGALEPDRAVAGFQVMVAVTLAAADVAYFLAWQTYGRMPTGLRRVVHARVPSTVHRRSRSWHVFHGPKRSGGSRHGAPVRSFHRIPLMT